MLFSTTNTDKTYTYDDFLMRNRMKYYLLVPAVVLLAAVVYLFFLYDPNPSKNSNNGASEAPDELKQISSPEIEATTVADAVEFKQIAVTLPSAEKSSNEAPSNEESQPEVVASVEESSSESALSEETESMVSEVSAADENTTEVTAEETALAAAVDDSTEESLTSAAVDESMEETITPAAAEESIEDSPTEDIPAKRVTYVIVGSSDSPQAGSAGDDSRETAPPQPEMQSQSVVADDQPQLTGDYIEYQAVITSSISRATSDAGLSANQSARIGRIFKPYLDLRRELRKGDKLTILLDPGVAKTGNDAEQIYRLEFHGARKNLVVTRKEGSLSDYEVRDADGKMLSGKDFQAAMAVEKPRREVSVEPAPRRVANNNTATGNMKRLESIPGESSDAHDGDVNSGARKPFWKRLGFGSSNGDENSGARKPFWKKMGFGSSSAKDRSE